MLFRKQSTRIARATTAGERAWQINGRAQTQNVEVIAVGAGGAQCWRGKIKRGEHG
jgi:hypothetical protein